MSQPPRTPQRRQVANPRTPQNQDEDEIETVVMRYRSETPARGIRYVTPAAHPHFDTPGTVQKRSNLPSFPPPSPSPAGRGTASNARDVPVDPPFATHIWVKEPVPLDNEEFRAYIHDQAKNCLWKVDAKWIVVSNAFSFSLVVTAC